MSYRIPTIITAAAALLLVAVIIFFGIKTTVKKDEPKQDSGTEQTQQQTDIPEGAGVLENGVFTSTARNYTFTPIEGTEYFSDYAEECDYFARVNADKTQSVAIYAFNAEYDEDIFNFTQADFKKQIEQSVNTEEYEIEYGKVKKTEAAGYPVSYIHYIYTYTGTEDTGHEKSSCVMYRINVDGKYIYTLEYQLYGDTDITQQQIEQSLASFRYTGA